MVMMPSLVVSAFFAVPLLSLDLLLHRGYDSLAEESETLDKCEVGMGNLANVGKLYFLVGKLVAKQAIRVAGKQVERRGGVKGVVGDVCGGVSERAASEASEPFVFVLWLGPLLNEQSLCTKFFCFFLFMFLQMAPFSQKEALVKPATRILFIKISNTGIFSGFLLCERPNRNSEGYREGDRGGGWGSCDWG